MEETPKEDNRSTLDTPREEKVKLAKESLDHLYKTLFYFSVRSNLKYGPVIDILDEEIAQLQKLYPETIDD